MQKKKTSLNSSIHGSKNETKSKEFVYDDTKIEEKNIAPVKTKSSLERSNLKREFKRVKRQTNTASKPVILSTDQYLTHYWPICNGTMRDVVGSADMTQGNLTSFTTDRFGNGNSALALNGGWTQVPSGIYFNTPELTMSVWVYPLSVGYYSRIIDFGNGPTADNIIFSLSNEITLQPYFQIFSGSSIIFTAFSNRVITQNKWQFLTATFNGTNATIYLDGIIIGETSIHSYIQPFNLSRSNCYIGKSAWNTNGYSSSYLDDLRFYNKCLTQEEILQIMNSYSYETSMFPYIITGSF
jgi:hypothetical protein